MSQGGLNHGYSLYLKDGRPGFAVRLEGEFHSVMGPTAISGRTFLSGAITSDRRLVLQVNGETVAEATVPDLILDMPVDPPVVGFDTNRGVVELLLPPFQGKMNRVAVYRGGRAEPLARPTVPRGENLPPNIIVIISDDLCVMEVGAYGGVNVKTPRLDALAAQGMRFERCYAPVAMCVPLRNTLFTGLFPVRTGSYRNHQYCRPGTISVVQYLDQLGYRSGLAGKIHVGPRASFPFEMVPGLTRNCVSATDDYTFEYVKEFMTRDRNEPFFLKVGLIQPHAPWTLGDRSVFDPEKLVLQPHWVDTPETRRSFVNYLAEVAFLDNQVGEFLDILDDLDLTDNTVVLFLSEQGAQFPGAKWTLWDIGVRNAAMIRWSGVVEPGSVSGAIIQYVDFVPTFLDIARRGQPPAPTEPFDLDNLDLCGTSFLPLLEGKTDVHGKYAFGIHNNIPEGPPYPIRSVRMKQFSYIRNLLPEEQYINRWIQLDANHEYYVSWRRAAEMGCEHAIGAIQRNEWRPAEELYDRSQDPWELNNLVDCPDHQEILQYLREVLDDWMKQQNDPGTALDVRN